MGDLRYNNNYSLVFYYMPTDIFVRTKTDNAIASRAQGVRIDHLIKT